MPEGKNDEKKNNTSRPYTVLELHQEAEGGPRLWEEHPPVEAADKRTAIKQVLGDREGTCEAVANFKPVRREIGTKVVTKWEEA